MASAVQARFRVRVSGVESRVSWTCVPGAASGLSREFWTPSFVPECVGRGELVGQRAFESLYMKEPEKMGFT